jgi:hypothetical protein
MNVDLLSRFADELRSALRHHYLDEPRWFAPVLALPFDRARNHLVVVLESPGPFCFLRESSPFAGATAPVRLGLLQGAEVTDVSVEGRVLRIDARTRREAWNLSLRIALFGANGSATLSRGDAVMETLGRPARAGRAPATTPATPGTDRFVLVTHGRAAAAMPRPADHAPHGEQTILGVFDDARSACAHIGNLVLDEAQALMLHRIARPARRKLESLRRLAQNLESDLEQAGTHQDERREAEALAAFQTRIRAGSEFAEIPDLYQPGRTLRVTLDPALPVHVQVEKRFRRAAKLEKAMTHLSKRRELVTREHAELDAALEMLAGVSSFGDALRLYEVMRAKFGIALERVAQEQKTGGKKAAAEKTYRTFDLDPRWYVMVGRSNQENDEITFRVSSPGDWWFHAEGVPGSHVVLRPRGGGDAPPARVIEQAASIAAHFSKARHSSLVPVIYTRRRYVRKFRGAEPGQVKCERETMVMVPPVLPVPASGQ